MRPPAGSAVAALMSANLERPTVHPSSMTIDSRKVHGMIGSRFVERFAIGELPAPLGLVPGTAANPLAFRTRGRSLANQIRDGSDGFHAPQIQRRNRSPSPAMCPCESMKPGTTVAPFRSMRRFGLSFDVSSPTKVMRPACTAMAFAAGCEAINRVDSRVLEDDIGRLRAQTP